MTLILEGLNLNVIVNSCGNDRVSQLGKGCNDDPPPPPPLKSCTLGKECDLIN